MMSALAPAMVAVGEHVVAVDAPGFVGPPAPVDFAALDVVEQAATATASTATDTNVVVPRAFGLTTASECGHGHGQISAGTDKEVAWSDGPSSAQRLTVRGSSRWAFGLHRS